MPALLALILSSFVDYGLSEIFGLSGATGLLISFLVGTVAYYALRSFFRNLRGY